jgi:hypothetical protein
MMLGPLELGNTSRSLIWLACKPGGAKLVKREKWDQSIFL